MNFEHNIINFTFAIFRIGASTLDPTWAILAPSWASWATSWASLGGFLHHFGYNLRPLCHFRMILTSFVMHFVDVFKWTRLGRPGQSQGDLISGQFDRKDPLVSFGLGRLPMGRDHLGPPDRSLDKSDRSLTSHLDSLTGHLGHLDVLLGRSWRPLGSKWAILGPLGVILSSQEAWNSVKTIVFF